MSAIETELPVWDLSKLYRALDDANLQADLDSATQKSVEIEAEFRDRIASLDARGLADLVKRVEEVSELLTRIGSYLQLRLAQNLNDDATRTAISLFEEKETQIANRLLFIDLEWAGLDELRASEILSDPSVAKYQHYLDRLRATREHLLSELEEQLASQKNLTGRSLWVRLFSTASEKIAPKEPDGSPMALEVALARLRDPQRKTRTEAATAITEALEAEPGLSTRASIYNAILADHALEDRLRGFSTWISARNLANEISDSSVAALVEATTASYPLVARWYHLKRQMLGLASLDDADRYAPLQLDDSNIEFATAKELVLKAYHSFSPRMASIAEGFFDGYLDAPVRSGKESGAFSHPTTPEAHPYIMLNFTGTHDDVMTMAHELGHGVHQVLAARQGFINSQTPLTLAETASIFGETVTFEALLSKATPREALSLLSARVESVFATVFRQVSMHCFEEEAHGARRRAGEVPIGALNEMWMTTQQAMFCDSLTLNQRYESWWSYIPHFIHTPGYVYSYAFGELLAMSIHAAYQRLGSGFIDSYLGVLAAGGSASPAQILSKVGLNIDDPEFWSTGLKMIELLIVRAETAAAELSQ